MIKLAEATLKGIAQKVVIPGHREAVSPEPKHTGPAACGTIRATVATAGVHGFRVPSPGTSSGVGPRNDDPQAAKTGGFDSYDTAASRLALPSPFPFDRPWRSRFKASAISKASSKAWLALSRGSQCVR